MFISKYFSLLSYLRWFHLDIVFKKEIYFDVIIIEIVVTVKNSTFSKISSFNSVQIKIVISRPFSSFFEMSLKYLIFPLFAKLLLYNLFEQFQFVSSEFAKILVVMRHSSLHKLNKTPNKSFWLIFPWLNYYFYGTFYTAKHVS